MPRRDLVWALEVLLWRPDTWVPAVESLYLLAQEENETWSNNATGQFTQAFSLFLSGTLVPYADRAEWLERRIDLARPRDLPLLSRAAAAGLQSHYMRTAVGFAGGGEPEDWRPRSEEEVIGVRGRAMLLLLKAIDRDDWDRSDSIQALSQSSRLVFACGLGAAFDREIRGRQWTPTEKAALSSGVRGVVKYDTELPSEIRDLALKLHNWLLGDDLAVRLQTVLSTSEWDLHLDKDEIHNTPEILSDLAAALVDADGGLDLLFDSAGTVDDPSTRYALCRLVASAIGASDLGGRALAREDWVALAAALTEADTHGEGNWATGVLEQLADSTNAQRVPELLRSLSLDEERAGIALDLIDEGKAEAGFLGHLLYGARIRPLNAPIAMRLMRAVCSAGNVEAALGMLDQWLDANEHHSDAMQDIAADLARRGVESSGTMIDHYIERLVRHAVLDAEALLSVFESRSRNRDSLISGLDVLLVESLIELAPAELASSFLSMIQEDEPPSFGLFSASDLAVLSKLAGSIGAEAVWSRIGHWPELKLRRALHHMNWRGDEPDPLVARFLTSDRLEEVANEASICFFNTLGVVSGPYHLAMGGELARARCWREALADTSAVAWADNLIDGYVAQIEWYKDREAEDDIGVR